MNIPITLQKSKVALQILANMVDYVHILEAIPFPVVVIKRDIPVKYAIHL